jgi:hypothetical protein
MPQPLALAAITHAFVDADGVDGVDNADGVDGWVMWKMMLV